MKIRKNTLNIKKLFTILVVWLPILDIYAFPLQSSIGIGDFLFLLLLPVFLFCLKGKTEHNRYIIYIGIFYCISFFSLMVLQHRIFPVSKIMFRMLRDLFYVMIGIVFSQAYLEQKYFIEIYKKSVWINCLCVCIQSFLFYGMKIVFFPIIPNQMLLGGTISDLIIKNRVEKAVYGNFMPSSFFLERGDFAWYVLPCVVLYLYGAKDKKYGKALLVSGVIVLTTSASGLIGLICIWGFCLLKFLLCVKKKNKEINFFTVGGITAIGGSVVLFAYTNIGMRLICRVKEVIDGVEGIRLSSGYLRVIKGFEVYLDLPFPYQIFGIGAGNLVNFAQIHTGFLEKFNQNGMLEYMSGITYILVSGGILSLVLFLFTMWHYYNKGKLLAKATVLLTITMLCISSFYASPFYVIYLIFICSWQRKRIGKGKMKLMIGENELGYFG